MVRNITIQRKKEITVSTKEVMMSLIVTLDRSIK